MHVKLRTVRLVLGLLQVVGTVKTKGTHFSTGPTTSSRHSNKGTHFSTGPTTSSRHSKKLKALILVLGLLQVVGTVKINVNSLSITGASRFYS